MTIWTPLKTKQPAEGQLIVLRYRNTTSTQRFRKQDVKPYYESWSMRGGKSASLYWIALD